MSEVVLAKIEEKEKFQILLIDERGNALKELFSCLENLDLTDNQINELRNKIKEDIENANLNYIHWWDNIIKKYNLNIIEKNEFRILFDTNEIILLNEKGFCS